MSALWVEELGAGDSVVLLHGTVAYGSRSFAAQLPLAERWRLLIPHRRGYGASPKDGPVGWDRDAADLPALLPGEGAHVVGFSAGALAALAAAPACAERIRSLALLEPPAYGIALDVPAVAELYARVRAVFAADLTASQHEAAFLRAYGFAWEERELSPEVAEGTLVSRRERDLGEAVFDLGALRAAPFPTLVVSGGWHPAMEAIAERLAAELGAERLVLPGALHHVNRVPELNDHLEAFWRSAG